MSLAGGYGVQVQAPAGFRKDMRLITPASQKMCLRESGNVGGLTAFLDKLADIGSSIQEFFVNILQDISPVVRLELDSVTADPQLPPLHDVFRDQEMNSLAVIRDRERLISFSLAV